MRGGTFAYQLPPKVESYRPFDEENNLEGDNQLNPEVPTNIAQILHLVLLLQMLLGIINFSIKVLGMSKSSMNKSIRMRVVLELKMYMLAS